jgi:hypothetical protein
MKYEKKVAVVIPMYNFPEMTQECIGEVIKNVEMDVDIAVVDDGSITPFVDDRVKIILRHDENKGFTAAMNAGIIWCNNRYEYILTLNNDTLPEKGWLKPLVDVLDNDKEVAIAGSTKITKRDPYLVENTAIDLLFGWHMYTTEDLTEDIVYCVWFGLTSALMRSSVIREVGLWDKRFRNHCSDNEFCYRCIMAGYRIALVPKSKVFHLHEVTTRHSGVNTQEDGLKLLDKIRGTDMQRILDTLPLDHGNNNWGKLMMEIYSK